MVRQPEVIHKRASRNSRVGRRLTALRFPQPDFWGGMTPGLYVWRTVCGRAGLYPSGKGREPLGCQLRNRYLREDEYGNGYGCAALYELSTSGMLTGLHDLAAARTPVAPRSDL